MKKSSLSCQANITPESAIHGRSSSGSLGRRSSTLVGGSDSRRNGRDGGQEPARRPVKVMDEDGNNVTPLSLHHTEPGDQQPKQGSFFLDEIFHNLGSVRFHSTSSFSIRSSSSFMGKSLSGRSYEPSLTKDTEDSLPKLDINPPAPCTLPRKTDSLKEPMNEKKLDEALDICLCETNTISLLDIPNTLFSEDADEAETIKERSIHYSELCKNKMGNEKYVARSAQTFSGATKEKQIQCDKIVMVDLETMATAWDIYDSFCCQNESTKSETVNYPDSPSNIEEMSLEKTSSSSMTCTDSTMSSLLEIGNYGSSVNIEPDPQWIMDSESFQHNLSLMERNIMANIFQSTLAAYRHLPNVEDPDGTVKSENKEQIEDKTSSLKPALEHLWTFSIDLTRGWNITSMSWNKKIPDLLAVGYGEIRNHKPGLICCWSLKNPVWPERVFHSHSCVTSLDFSFNNPGQLAVGMLDGTVALYNVECQENTACIASNRGKSNKHMNAVCRVQWTRQELRLSGEERTEALVSVSADGKIKRWFLTDSTLDCIDLMELRRNNKKQPVPIEKKDKAARVLALMIPALSMDIHPIDSSIYLIGTLEGKIHKCSFSNRQNFLTTYQKHFGLVNHIEWSPFSRDVFLSCSSDWTIQLWRQNLPSPVLSFTSAKRSVNCVRWSPLHSTVFAAVNGQQVEIWDLSTSLLNPTIVHCATPGVKMRVVLFATGSDCILVGDSEGKVTVYKLKNFGVGNQVDSLDDIVRSAVARDQL